MTDSTPEIVPIWTLATEVMEPPVAFDDSMNAARLSELRGVLATLAAAPITTLEVRPKPASLDTSGGMSFSDASPIAHQLSSFIAQAPKVPNVAKGSETLYRMTVPAKVASKFSSGALRAMPSKAVAGGVHSALIGDGKIVSNATYVPVTAGAATAGALTVAGPLIVLAVAAGASVHAEQQRRAAIEKITVLLEKLHQDRLDDERNRLDGCRNAIDKATAILLDKGMIGFALGLDTAVNTIDTSIATAERRVKGWLAALDKLPTDKVELPRLADAIKGIDSADSEFYAHLEMADLAIALKRRVLVLQAVEHAQKDEANAFQNFTAALRLDAQNLEQLIGDLDQVRTRLASLQIDRTHGTLDFSFSSGAVDKLLHTSQRLRDLGDQVSRPLGQADVAIDIVRNADGSVVVLPPLASS